MPRTTESRIELVTTIVMSLAAILTAWSAFQSSSWGSVTSREYTLGNAARVESTRADTRAGQDRGVDLAVFTSWIEAFYTDMNSGVIERNPGVRYQPTPGTLSGFIYERVRPEFMPAFHAWLERLAEDGETAPPSPFAMDEYQLANAALADELLTQAGVHFDNAQEAGNNGSRYTLLTVGFALTIFFAGITGKLDGRKSKLITASLAVILAMGLFVVLLTLPRVPVF